MLITSQTLYNEGNPLEVGQRQPYILIVYVPIHVILNLIWRNEGRQQPCWATSRRLNSDSLLRALFLYPRVCSLDVVSLAGHFPAFFFSLLPLLAMLTVPQGALLRVFLVHAHCIEQLLFVQPLPSAYPFFCAALCCSVWDRANGHPLDAPNLVGQYCQVSF
jgi:hypothetical protein